MLMLQIHNQFGLPISTLCKRFELPRASFYRRSSKDDGELSERIKTIAMEHPAWGYRLIMAELTKQVFKVNHKHKKVYIIYCYQNLQKPVVKSIPASPVTLKPHLQSFQDMYGRRTSFMTG